VENERTDVIFVSMSTHFSRFFLETVQKLIFVAISQVFFLNDGKIETLASNQTFHNYECMIDYTAKLPEIYEYRTRRSLK
jgi:hypothetical protein